MCPSCLDTCATCSIINECSTCKRGFFGKTCHKKCSPGCKDDVCEINTGSCICKEFYIGTSCNLCFPGRF
jgi:hypothetical protein